MGELWEPKPMNRRYCQMLWFDYRSKLDLPDQNSNFGEVQSVTTENT